MPVVLFGSLVKAFIFNLQVQATSLSKIPRSINAKDKKRNKINVTNTQLVCILLKKGQSLPYRQQIFNNIDIIIWWKTYADFSSTHINWRVIIVWCANAGCMYTVSVSGINITIHNNILSWLFVFRSETQIKSYTVYSVPAYMIIQYVLRIVRMVHYNDLIMSAMACQITSLTIVYSTVYSGAGQTKH